LGILVFQRILDVLLLVFNLLLYISLYSESFRMADREPYAVYREPNKVY